jgi:hypothetical protein
MAHHQLGVRIDPLGEQHPGAIAERRSAAFPEKPVGHPAVEQLPASGIGLPTNSIERREYGQNDGRCGPNHAPP